jgi:integrase
VATVSGDKSPSRGDNTAEGQDTGMEVPMPAVSSHPVVYRGRRVPNLWKRELADGTFVYEYAGRVAGKPTRRKLRAGSDGEAVRAARRFQVEIENRKAAGPTTLTEAVERWLAYLDGFVAAREFSPTTRDLYAGRVGVFADTVGGRRRITEVTTSHVRQLLDRLRRDGLTAATRNGYLIALRSFFRYCTEHDLRDDNPVDELPKRERPSGKRGRVPRRLDVEQVDALIAELGDQFQTIGEVIAYQALRVSEVLGLRWEIDIDLRAGTLTVDGQLYDGEWVDRVKTPSSRAVVPMFPHTEQALRRWRSRQAELDLNLVRPGRLAFTTLTGKPQRRDNVRRAIQHAADKAGLHTPGLTRVTTHDLRGSAGSIALAKGVTLAEVAHYLRHASPYVTATMYADVLERQKGAAIVTQLVQAGWGG